MTNINLFDFNFEVFNIDRRSCCKADNMLVTALSNKTLKLIILCSELSEIRKDYSITERRDKKDQIHVDKKTKIK